MAEPILKLPRGVPKTDREWESVFRNITKFLRVSGNQLVIGGEIVLPPASVGTEELEDGSVTDVKLRDSQALSVVGRAQNSAGKPEDIQASANGDYFRRSSDTLGFGPIQASDIPSSIARLTDVTSAISDHESEIDPHSQYTTSVELVAALGNYATTESATYTATLTGCTTSPTGTIRLVRSGNVVLAYIPVITGTSNAATCSLTGTIPAGFLPARTQDVLGRATDNGVNGICGYRINTSGTIEMFFGAALAGWTAAGTKGTNNSTIPWSID